MTALPLWDEGRALDAKGLWGQPFAALASNVVISVLLTS
jgi:hypothetical protein